MFYIAFFSFSLGPIILLLVSEIFPLKFRVLNEHIHNVKLLFNFTGNIEFLPLINKISESYTFYLYGMIAIICLFYVYFMVPETKGITLEKIEENWQNGVNPRDF